MAGSTISCCEHYCGGFYPWELTCCETLLHSIPGIGTISSFASWICTKKEMRSLNEEDGQPIRTLLYDVASDGGRYQLLSKQSANRMTICIINLFASAAVAFTSLYLWGDKK